MKTWKESLWGWNIFKVLIFALWKRIMRTTRCVRNKIDGILKKRSNFMAEFVQYIKTRNTIAPMNFWNVFEKLKVRLCRSRGLELWPMATAATSSLM
ncbi:hypothetical protein AXF13_07970 [Desulfovibrio fairfieldensis]|uniref:Uncharacterized protein n=1 Tax=Desulfovibrio fairfieldensis TaxID=44742 RepID=A0A0X8JJQ4_9BACT|nr:hypothetical protein AXF13_07970 [Desulfovibrio fairfieldensis]